MYLYAHRVLLPLLLCVATRILLLLLQQQCFCFVLSFVIVCWMAKFVAGSMNLIAVFSSSSLKHDLLSMYPLAVLSHSRPRFV